MRPLVELVVDGRRYGGWTAVRVTRGVERMAADFDLTVTEAWPGRSEPWAIRPGSACRLLVEGEPLIDGWTDDYAPSFSARDHRAGIGGRSRTADLVDCSVMQAGGQFKGCDLAQIARTLCAPFGVPVRIDEGVAVGAPFPDVQVQQGETVFELLDRLASLRGVLLTDGPDGALVVTVAGCRRASGALVQGVNILEASATLAHRERYSLYVVKGQRAGSDEVFRLDAAQVSAEAADPAVTRHRPLLLLAEGQVDPAAARIRARWEALARGPVARGARHRAGLAPAQRGIVVLVSSGQTGPIMTAAYHGASSPIYQVLANSNVQNVNNSYGAVSDASLKHQVSDATPKLDELRQVRGVNYILKDDPRQLKQIGMIARELEGIWPGLIEDVPVIERRQKLDEHGEPLFEAVGRRQRTVAETVEKERKRGGGADRRPLGPQMLA
jgi:prophage tail gpP-like protein